MLPFHHVFSQLKVVDIVTKISRYLKTDEISGHVLASLKIFIKRNVNALLHNIDSLVKACETNVGSCGKVDIG